VDRLRQPFQSALKDASLTSAEINEVVLVGGATRMPMVQDLVRSLTKKDPHKGVNPDEVVAVGAAIQAGVLSGEVKDILLLDVTPLSLGLETMGGVMTVLIERNTTIPVKKSEVFSTADDGQTAVDVHILQGERPMSVDNMSLGRFRLEGIPPAPRGTPQIEVTFDIDANGILNVTAHDKATGKEQTVKVTASTNLNKDEIERKVREAREHEADDRRQRELIQARNSADGLAYQTEKALRELQEKVPTSDRQNIEAKLSQLREAIKGSDISLINKLSSDVQNAFYALSQQLYATQSPQQPGNGSHTESGHNGNGQKPGHRDDEGEVVEGEFRDL
jgi:molecular chaperone DnaK